MPPPGTAPKTTTPTPDAAAPPEKPPEKIVATLSYIAPSADDEFLEGLLAVFGPIKSYRRPRDPKTNAPKSFAFIEYTKPSSMNVALRVRAHALLCRLSLTMSGWGCTARRVPTGNKKHAVDAVSMR